MDEGAEGNRRTDGGRRKTREEWSPSRRIRIGFVQEIDYGQCVDTIPHQPSSSSGSPITDTQTPLNVVSNFRGQGSRFVKFDSRDAPERTAKAA